MDSPEMRNPVAENRAVWAITADPAAGSYLHVPVYPCAIEYITVIAYYGVTTDAHVMINRHALADDRAFLKNAIRSYFRARTYAQRS